MDDELKVRFEALESRFLTIEKRFDDIKWYFGGVATIISAGIAIYSILVGFNFNRELDRLRDFKQEVREAVLGTTKPATIEILSEEGSPLDGKEILARIETDDKKDKWLVFSTMVRNSGNGTTGPIFVKIYSPDAIKLNAKATDEKDPFRYEAYYMPKDIRPNDLPASYSSAYDWLVLLKEEPQPGQYPMMMKMFYGGKLTVARFSVSLKK